MDKSNSAGCVEEIANISDDTVEPGCSDATIKHGAKQSQGGGIKVFVKTNNEVKEKDINKESFSHVHEHHENNIKESNPNNTGRDSQCKKDCNQVNQVDNDLLTHGGDSDTNSTGNMDSKNNKDSEDKTRNHTKPTSNIKENNPQNSEVIDKNEAQTSNNNSDDGGGGGGENNSDNNNQASSNQPSESQGKQDSVGESSSNAVEKKDVKKVGNNSLKVVGLIRKWATGRQAAAEPQERPDSFLERYGMGAGGGGANPTTPDPSTKSKLVCFKCHPRKLKEWVIDPSSTFYYRWLAVISFACLYNLTIIIARSVFWKLQNNYVVTWLVLDYLCDFIYVGDMFVQFRTGYLHRGLMVREPKLLRSNYIHKREFKLDVMSLFPTDILYLIPPDGLSRAYVRLNRLFKMGRMFEFFDRTDNRTNYPNLFRICKLVLYIVIIIHWNGCFYFQVSNWLGFGSDGWVYYNISDAYPVNQTLSRMYIYSFYWSTLTLTTIGETPKPENDIEFIIVTVDFIFGILIFATIVGNVGSMISNMNAQRSSFQQSMDRVKRYIEMRGVPKVLEKRIIKWFDYVWNNKQSLDEEEILKKLPDKLRAEIAIYVHLDTLKRVSIFADCEPGLLTQLVLRLKLSIFSPGDYVCRKGDIGKEMYIVKKGVLSVVADDGKTVLVTLSEGCVFGEVSILNIPGNKTGNRRTANVRSIGYSDLFVLSKNDLWSALSEYPDAKSVLLDRGKEILKKDNLFDEEMSAKVCKQQLSEKEKLIKLENEMEAVITRLARFTGEYASFQSKLKQRVAKLERKSSLFRDSDSISLLEIT